MTKPKKPARRMTILDRIQAGQYPTDKKGRPLVPVSQHGPTGKIGWTATIVATDAPEGIVGFGPNSTCCWTEKGIFFKPGAAYYTDGDLLPPRKN